MPGIVGECGDPTPPAGRTRTADLPNGDPDRYPGRISCSPEDLVGEEGFEPSRPFGHTDLNRARLPFRHPPWATRRLARPRALLRPGYDRVPFRHPPWATRRLARPRALLRPGYDRGQATRREVARWEFCSASSVGSRAWSRVPSLAPSGLNCSPSKWPARFSVKWTTGPPSWLRRSEEHTSELQSL